MPEGRTVTSFAICREREADGETSGWISLVGVRPQWRARGLGEALLLYSLHEFQEAKTPARSTERRRRQHHRRAPPLYEDWNGADPGIHNLVKGALRRGFVGRLIAPAAAAKETGVVETPDVHYARSGDVSIAYQVVGVTAGGSGVRSGVRSRLRRRPHLGLGSTAARSLHRCAHRVCTRDPDRQARYGALRSGSRSSDARDAHGRPAGRDGRRRLGERDPLDCAGGRPPRNPVRGDLSRACCRSRPVRSDSQGAPHR